MTGGSQVDPHPAMTPERLHINEGDLLVVRRRHDNPPFDDELESLADLAASCGARGVLVLGVDDSVEAFPDERLAEIGLARARSAVVRPTRDQLGEVIGLEFLRQGVVVHPEDADAAADALLAEFWPGTPEGPQ